MRCSIRSLVILVALFFTFSPAIAQERTLAGADEERARALFQELRCVVCQNQSIDSSDADVARDLRKIVREQVETGKSNGQIRQYLVSRYGEFVLLKPRFAWHTLALWLMPIVLLICGALLIFRSRAKTVAKTTTPQSSGALSDDEQQELDALLKPRSKD